MRSFRIGFFVRFGSSEYTLNARDLLTIDLTTTMVADSGMRVQAGDGPGYVTCRMWTSPSAFGGQYAHFYLVNWTNKSILAIPSFGHSNAFYAIGHHRVWCDPEQVRTFRFRIPEGERIDRVCMYVEGACVQCVFIFPLTSGKSATVPADLVAPLLAVGGGIAVGVIASIAWQQFAQSRRVQAPRPSKPAPPPPQTHAPEPPPPPAPEPEAPPVDTPETFTLEEPAPAQYAPAYAAAELSHVETPEPMPSAVIYADPIIEEPRTSVAFTGEGSRVVASLELLERKLYSANYVLKIVNDSLDPVLCAAMGAHGSQHSALTPAAFRVEPKAALAVLVHVPLRLWSPFRQIFVNMRSRSMSYSLQASVPRSPLFGPVSALVALLFIIVAAALTIGTMRPRITAYAVPDVALAGSQIRAAYAVSGVGSASYDVTVGDRHVASGSLALGSGYFEFTALPRAARYRVALTLAGPLGTRSEARTLSTVEQRRSVTGNTAAFDSRIRSRRRHRSVRFADRTLCRAGARRRRPAHRCRADRRRAGAVSQRWNERDRRAEGDACNSVPGRVDSESRLLAASREHGYHRASEDGHTLETAASEFARNPHGEPIAVIHRRTLVEIQRCAYTCSCIHLD